MVWIRCGIQTNEIMYIQKAGDAVLLFRFVTFLPSSGRCVVPYKWYPNISSVWYGLCHTRIYIQGRTLRCSKSSKLHVTLKVYKSATCHCFDWCFFSATTKEGVPRYIAFDRPQLGINSATHSSAKDSKEDGQSEIDAWDTALLWKESPVAALNLYKWCHIQLFAA